MSTVMSSCNAFGLDVDICTNHRDGEAAIYIYPAPHYDQPVVRTEDRGPLILGFNRENNLVRIEIKKEIDTK